ncbi:hypothetical protein K466DRAFT_173104 [Polyporus arcularius HHB13444]|uniref:Uncharacterized protein n=1 Tax=Polyporus arcularius HHB13444 TaxID=1314778 RepID=A0A5C3P8T1_9APHY|nr:hypothetical protein K466DRAFT_173104 [Polyporus arcularius HHB13444]
MSSRAAPRSQPLALRTQAHPPDPLVAASLRRLSLRSSSGGGNGAHMMSCLACCPASAHFDPPHTATRPLMQIGVASRPAAVLLTPSSHRWPATHRECPLEVENIMQPFGSRRMCPGFEISYAASSDPNSQHVLLRDHVKQSQRAASATTRDRSTHLSPIPSPATSVIGAGPTT